MNAYRSAARIDYVDLVARRIHGYAARVGSHRKHAVLPHVDDIQHRHRIAAAIRDVGVFAVICRVRREAGLLTTGRAEREECEQSQEKRG